MHALVSYPGKVFGGDSIVFKLPRLLLHGGVALGHMVAEAVCPSVPPLAFQTGVVGQRLYTGHRVVI